MLSIHIYSKDAVKLAETHECLKAGKHEIDFFIEHNTGDSSDINVAVTISVSVDILYDPNVGRAFLKNINALYANVSNCFFFRHLQINIRVTFF